MAEKAVIYRLKDAKTSAELLKKLDQAYSPDEVVGMGVIARGYLDDPEEFYVFANTEDFSPDKMRALHRLMAEFGSVTDFSLGDLRKPPTPHFQTAGPIETILPAMRAYYPEAGI